MFNAACTAKPLYIVLPKTAQDVSHILKTAKAYNTPIRSGFRVHLKLVDLQIQVRPAGTL